MANMTPEQLEYVGNVVKRRQEGKAVTPEELTTAAGYLGMELDKFKQMYKGVGAADFGPLSEAFKLDKKTGAPTGGMDASEASPLYRFMEKMNLKYGDENHDPLSRGVLRKILRKAEKEGRTVSYTEGEDGLIRFRFDTDGSGFNSGYYALDNKAAEYLRAVVGEQKYSSNPDRFDVPQASSVEFSPNVAKQALAAVTDMTGNGPVIPLSSVLKRSGEAHLG